MERVSEPALVPALPAIALVLEIVLLLCPVWEATAREPAMVTVGRISKTIGQISSPTGMIRSMIECRDVRKTEMVGKRTAWITARSDGRIGMMK